MPNSEKVSADARGASIATADARKRANPILSLSDEETLQRFKSLTEDELLTLAPLFRVFFYLISIWVTKNSKSHDKHRA